MQMPEALQAIKANRLCLEQCLCTGHPSHACVWQQQRVADHTCTCIATAIRHLPQQVHAAGIASGMSSSHPCTYCTAAPPPCPCLSALVVPSSLCRHAATATPQHHVDQQFLCLLLLSVLCTVRVNSGCCCADNMLRSTTLTRSSGSFFLVVRASLLRRLLSVPCKNACELLHHHIFAQHVTFTPFLKHTILPNTMFGTARGKRHPLLHVAICLSVVSDTVIPDRPARYDCWSVS